MTVEIELTQGKTAVIDDEDYELVQAYKWHAVHNHGIYYAAHKTLAIYQDRDGFIWIGTEDGLNRYDGSGFVVYKHDAADPGSLPYKACGQSRRIARGTSG